MSKQPLMKARIAIVDEDVGRNPEFEKLRHEFGAQ
jgi:hypothetical protein